MGGACRKWLWWSVRGWLVGGACRKWLWWSVRGWWWEVLVGSGYGGV